MHERLRATPIDPVTREPKPMPVREPARPLAGAAADIPAAAVTHDHERPELGSINLGAMSVEDHEFIKHAASNGPESRAVLCAAADITLMELDAMVDSSGKVRKEAYNDEHAAALRRLCLVHRWIHARHEVRSIDRISQKTAKGAIHFQDAVRTRFAGHRQAFGSEPLPAHAVPSVEHED